VSNIAALIWIVIVFVPVAVMVIAMFVALAAERIQLITREDGIGYANVATEHAASATRRMLAAIQGVPRRRAEGRPGSGPR
jgi:hypothetical protein